MSQFICDTLLSLGSTCRYPFTVHTTTPYTYTVCTARWHVRYNLLTKFRRLHMCPVPTCTGQGWNSGLKLQADQQELSSCWDGQPFTLATIDIGRKVGDAVRLSVGRELGPHLTRWSEAYLRTRWCPDPFSRLDTTDMADKWGLLCLFLKGELGSHLTQCGLVRRLPPYQVTSWSIQAFGHNTPTWQTDRTAVP